MPLLLQSAGARARQGRAVDGRMAARHGRGGRPRHPAGAFLRRRADGAPRSAGPGRPRPQDRALQQSHHLRRDAGPAADRAAQGGRARPRAAQHPGRRPPDGGLHRQLSRRPGQEAGLRPHGEGGGAAAHHQRRRQPPQHHAGRAHDRPRGRAGRGPGRDGARAILWLGDQEPRRLDADARARCTRRRATSRPRASGCAARS